MAGTPCACGSGRKGSECHLAGMQVRAQPAVWKHTRPEMQSGRLFLTDAPRPISPNFAQFCPNFAQCRQTPGRVFPWRRVLFAAAPHRQLCRRCTCATLMKLLADPNPAGQRVGIGGRLPAVAALRHLVVTTNSIQHQLMNDCRAASSIGRTPAPCGGTTTCVTATTRRRPPTPRRGAFSP